MPMPTTHTLVKSVHESSCLSMSTMLTNNSLSTSPTSLLYNPSIIALCGEECNEFIIKSANMLDMIPFPTLLMDPKGYRPLCVNASALDLFQCSTFEVSIPAPYTWPHTFFFKDIYSKHSTASPQAAFWARQKGGPSNTIRT